MSRSGESGDSVVAFIMYLMLAWGGIWIVSPPRIADISILLILNFLALLGYLYVLRMALRVLRTYIALRPRMKRSFSGEWLVKVDPATWIAVKSRTRPIIISILIVLFCAWRLYVHALFIVQHLVH